MFLLLVAAAGVAILHSIMPDHWVPLAVVARTNHWSMTRVARVTFLASIGHIIASVVLAGIIALIGLRFRQVIENQQGHIVGIVLILTGLVFMVLRLMGKGGHSHGDGHGHHHHHGHAHVHEHSHDHGQHHGHSHNHGHDQAYPFEWGGIYQLSGGEYHFFLDKGPDPEMKIAFFRVGSDSTQELEHARTHGVQIFGGSSRRVASGQFIEPGQSRVDLVLNGPDDFVFQVKEPGYYVLFTEHHPEEFSAKLIIEGTSISVLTHEEYPSAHDHHHEEPKTLLKRISAIAIPFGIAASPDLTILPVALAASAVSAALVIGTLLVFAIFTIATFMILTLIATKLGYQIKGEWLEKNAIMINAIMLMAIGVVSYVGF